MLLLCHRTWALLWMPPTYLHHPATQQEPFHPIRHQSTSQSWLGREKSPTGSLRLPQQEPSRSFHHPCSPIVLQTCQTWLSGCPSSVIIYTLFWLVQSTDKAQLLFCITHYPRHIHITSHELSWNDTFLVCVALILPKASRVRCEWQNHPFTRWYLALKSHAGLCFHPVCHRQLSSSACDVQ